MEAMLKITAMEMIEMKSLFFIRPAYARSVGNSFALCIICVINATFLTCCSSWNGL
jgi:hypothetical protein